MKGKYTMAKKEKAETQEKVKKPIYKKWWFWVIIVVLVFGVFGSGGNKDEEKAPAEKQPQTLTDLSLIG